MSGYCAEINLQTMPGPHMWLIPS